VAAVTARFSNASTRLQAGTAAVAIAAAAAFTPAVVAQAQPVDFTHVSEAVGASITDLWYVGDGANPLRPIYQNPLIWFGTPNANPPAGVTIFEFTPLPLIPGFLRPLYGWFTQNLNFEACILGATVKVGPYGTISGSLTRGC
jgi:hypothetical protein